MKASTMWKKTNVQLILATAFWLLVWQVTSMWIGEAVILASPFAVGKTLLTLMGNEQFWVATIGSSGRILLGFFNALLWGSVLAIISSISVTVRILLKPLIITVKNIPVASFIILALLWLKGGQLAIFISFMMVLPIVYANLLEGLLATDKKLLEMAKVFRMGKWKQITYIYLPAIKPFLLAACSVGFGMCWKSGIAAEVIGITTGSVGEAIYNAKIFLATDEVLAWTVVIIGMSMIFERLFLLLLERILKCLDKVRYKGMQGLERKELQTKDIVMESLKKSYQEQVVLGGFTETFQSGESICIMGPSGRGKTTLIRILMGMEQPDGGQILGGINGKYCCQFQEDRLIQHLNGVDNVALVSEYAAKEEIIESFQIVGMDAEDMEKPVSQLSGGQKRRVALVRALMARGEIIILDEPFKGLDEVTREKAALLVQKKKENRTLIAVTHDEEDVGLLGARMVRM